MASFTLWDEESEKRRLSVALCGMVLVTIPLSHYCEKARWALDRTRLPYREEAHAPLFSRFATKRVDGGTVPLLLDGDLHLIDSTSILVHADSVAGDEVLYPRDPALKSEVDALEETFDTSLGIHVRRWAYAQLLQDTAMLRSLWSSGVPRWEGRAIRAIAPLARSLVRRAYDISAESAQRSLNRVRDIFADIDGRLMDGRRFLVGERFTAADLTFAALAAPMLLPDGCRAVQPVLNHTPIAMQEEISRLRETEAGKFVLRLFAQERTTPAGVQASPLRANRELR